MNYRAILTILSVFIPFINFAQDGAGVIDEVFKRYTGWFVEFIFYEINFFSYFQIPWVVIILIGGGVYFTLYFKFINITKFRTALRVVSGKYEDIERHGVEAIYGEEAIEDNSPEENLKELEREPKTESDGEVTHFQALTAALSGTVGLGNIAGVAVAISIGGPGATFWMIVAGFIGMATKFVECTLGVYYRDIGPGGRVYGGPMYYLRKGLGEKGLGGLGKVMAVLFAIFVIGGSFGGGNMFQANQAAAQFVNLFGVGDTGKAIFGIGLAAVVAVVIIGGIRRIASFTEKVVPFMAVLYVAAGLVIIGINYMHVGEAFKLIYEGAFTGTGVTGGAIGVLIQGMRRGAFSNEAGIGSAAIAHSAVKTKYAGSEGIVALLEPFIDTIVICTMTALVIIISNFDGGFLEYGQKVTEGVSLTSQAYDSVIPNFSIVLTIAVILFAISTMISWSYYGLQGWAYLFGRSKASEFTYKAIFCIFIWIGSVISLGSVIDFSDAMIFAMAVPNIIGLVILAPVVRKELKRYLNAIRIKEESVEG